MPLKVNIKRKEPRFKGDQPKFNVVVSGPSETFTSNLRRQLEFQGLSPLSEDDGFEIWSSRPQIGGAPYYMAHYLKDKFSMEIHKDCRRDALAAVQQRTPEDGLERFLGAKVSGLAGYRALEVVSTKNGFAANCNMDDEKRQEFLRSAGWLPVKSPSDKVQDLLGSAPYRTNDPFIASNLEPFMTPGAKALLSEKLAAGRKNMASSRSMTDDDVPDVPCPEGLSFLPFQKSGIHMAIKSEGGAIIADDMGLGKAQPLSARILTPDGWVLMGDIKVGDVITGSQGQDIRVTGVFPQGRVDIYRLTFSDGAQTECCLDHLWYVMSEDGQAEVRTLRSLFIGGNIDQWSIPVLPEEAFPLGHPKQPAKRYFQKIEPIAKKFAQCISVNAPDHLYVTDDYIITHNTMQGIGVINALEDAKKVLVISQANMRIKWGREIEKWKVNQDLTVGLAESSNFPETDIAVINYDILQKNIESIRAVEWDVVICDEAHNLKNPEAKRTQAVLGDLMSSDGDKGIPLAPGGRIIHLTGTPKPNRVEELWPLISSTRPDIWGRGPEDFEIFKNRYAPPILIKKKMGPPGRQRDIIIPMAGEPTRLAELQARLRFSGGFIRRLKRDTDLPPKFRTPLEMPVKLSKSEKDMLREVEADLDAITKRIGTQSIKAGVSREAGAIIDAISVIDPDTPQFQEMARVRRNLGMIKAPHCAKFILDEIEAEKDFAPENRTKTVVFAHHKDVIKIIHDEAEKRMKGAFLVYDGGIGSAKKKQDIVDKFQNDDSVRGLIISLAGNTGITLTAAARMRVVEPDWSPSNMVQIEDRIWRIGQEKNVDIGYMSIAGTMDARIGMAIAQKMEADEKSINTISFSHVGTSQKDSSSLSKGQSPEESPRSEDDVTPLMNGEMDEQPSLPFT